jgi:hypothetical protein
LPPPAVEDYDCYDHGFDQFRNRLTEEISLRGGRSGSITSVSVHDFIRSLTRDTCEGSLALNRSTRDASLDFLFHLSSHDNTPEDVSLFDLHYSRFELDGRQWGEPWAEDPLAPFPGETYEGWLRTMGAPLLDPGSSPGFRAQAREYLEAYSRHLEGLPETNPLRCLRPALEFYLTGREAAVFRDYLQISWADWQGLSEERRAEHLAGRIAAQFPTASVVEDLYGLFSRHDQYLFCAACFRADAIRSFNLFEAAHVPRLADRRVGHEFNTDEFQLFPNLPQDTPFAERQAAIDTYLGTPVLDVKPYVAHYDSEPKATIPKWARG